ncbi:hypothetical protein [Mumia sp. Pv 4-285]|uniref:hypothetical protein n=1 Tax=Mumia qirimensis TaxID=3234852 RepID=UPI00351D1DA8
MDGSSREARFAVLSRRVLVLTAYALAAVAVVAFVTDRNTLGIAIVVLIGVLAFARAMWTVVRGLREIKRTKTELPTALVVATPDEPALVDVVVPALLALNSDDLPYRIDAAPTPGGVHVDVRWKSEELRWQTLFVRGRVAYSWRMEVRLDPTSARYAFTEWSATAKTRAAAGSGGIALDGRWTWKKGKTAYQRSMSFREGADGQVTVAGDTGPRTSWVGVTYIRPGEAKEPVFSVLRNHGWRPKHDWFGARLFEK